MIKRYTGNLVAEIGLANKQGRRSVVVCRADGVGNPVAVSIEAETRLEAAQQAFWLTNGMIEGGGITIDPFKVGAGFTDREHEMVLVRLTP